MAKVHQLNIGDIQVAILLEGESKLDLANLGRRYPNATEDEIVSALDGISESISSYNPIYINSNGTKIIVDTGFGKERRPDMGNLEPALESIGVSASEIDIVYLTHFHGDHIMGIVDADGELSFPNARYMTHEKEWDEWMGRWGDSEDEGHQRFLKMMKSLESQFILASEGDEVADGVTIVDIPGHTLGQSGLLIESNGERVIHLADVLHQPFQFKYTGWHFAFDSDGALGVQTRESILKRCADENLLTIFYHLQFPGLGYIKQVDGEFVWNAVE